MRSLTVVMTLIQILVLTPVYMKEDHQNSENNKRLIKDYLMNFLLAAAAISKIVNDVIAYFMIFRSITSLLKKYSLKLSQSKNAAAKRSFVMWRIFIYTIIIMMIFDSLNLVFMRIALMPIF